MNPIYQWRLAFVEARLEKLLTWCGTAAEEHATLGRITALTMEGMARAMAPDPATLPPCPVDECCPRCLGAGSRVYPSAVTWRGGMGGSVCTRDLCDRCWGSGDATAPWTDLRKLVAEEEQRVATRAVGLLAEMAGAKLTGMRGAVGAIADELERLAKGRKARPAWFTEACTSLARTLRRGIG